MRIENGKALEKDRLEHDVADKEAERASIIGKLETTGGEQIVVAKAETFAELVSLLGFDKAAVENVMSRVDILLVTIFLELSAIAALEYALAGLLQPATRTATVAAVTPSATPPGPKGGNRKSRRGATTKDPKVVTFVAEYRRRHGKNPTIGELQARFHGMPKTSAHRYATNRGTLGPMTIVRAA